MNGDESKNMAGSLERSSLPRHLDYLWGQRWAVQ